MPAVPRLKGHSPLHANSALLQQCIAAAIDGQFFHRAEDEDQSNSHERQTDDAQHQQEQRPNRLLLPTVGFSFGRCNAVDEVSFNVKRCRAVRVHRLLQVRVDPGGCADLRIDVTADFDH